MKRQVPTTSCSWNVRPRGIIATNIAAGDFRSASGARWYNDVFWAGAYVTGPTSGAIHSASSVSTLPGPASNTARPPALRARSSAATTTRCIIGADAEWLIQPPHNLIANTQTLTLSDRPELRIDPDDADLDRGDCKRVRARRSTAPKPRPPIGPLYLPRRILLVQCRSRCNTAWAMPEPEIPGWLRAGRLCPDRRNPEI